LGPDQELPTLARAPVEGRIVPLTGLVVTDCEVQFVPLAPPDEFQGAVRRRVACDADGNFRLGDLAIGQYRLRVLPGWARGGTWPDLLDPVQSAYQHGTEGEPLSLRLIDSRLRGQVVDGAGLPLEGALVLLSDTLEEAHIFRPVQSGPDGSFDMPGLPAGHFRMEVRAGEGVRELTVELSAAEDHQLEPIAISLRTSAPGG
jgi:hypothetical protein